MAAFSRANPSPRYHALTALYAEMHRKGDRFYDTPAEEVFDGHTLLPHVETIRRLIDRFSARSILDYGAGKGIAHRGPVSLPGGEIVGSLQDHWGVDRVVCFDPAYEPHARLPEGRFDGVISTDVLEHCPEEDMAWILGEMFAYANQFVFFNIACFPASKRLPNGENAHCTVREERWWRELVAETAARHPGVHVEAIFMTYPKPRSLLWRAESAIKRSIAVVGYAWGKVRVSGSSPRRNSRAENTRCLPRSGGRRRHSAC